MRCGCVFLVARPVAILLSLLQASAWALVSFPGSGGAGAVVNPGQGWAGHLRMEAAHRPHLG